jgi:hypothetical protein
MSAFRRRKVISLFCSVGFRELPIRKNLEGSSAARYILIRSSKTFSSGQPLQAPSMVRSSIDCYACDFCLLDEAPAAPSGLRLVGTVVLCLAASANLCSTSVAGLGRLLFRVGATALRKQSLAEL